MKVHNLGNDYAHQRKQKHQESVSPEQPTTTEVIPETNVGDQVQNRGEGEVVTATTETSDPKSKSKKKKEAGAENKLPED